MTISYPVDDTIAAIGSAQGGAARGVVRLSGPDAPACLARMFVAADGSINDVSRPTVLAGRLTLADPWPELECDAYIWPGARGYTGEPSVELHMPGSPPLLDAVLARCCECGARLAKPGEFTLRAFLAGRMDLTRAEAVLGVIDASDSDRLDAALRQLAGGLSAPLAQLRDDLIDALAHLEAGFDFADEDIEFISMEELDRRVRPAIESVGALQRQMAERTENVEHGRIVLTGRPNAGKSSLFNALAGLATHEQAIVSDLAGTTRDYLVAEVDLGGFAAELIDTAGIHTAEELQQHSDEPDRRAQSLAHRQQRAADLELFCIDATQPFGEWEERRLAEDRLQRLVVWTKCDEENEAYEIEALSRLGGDPIHTSVVSGRGLDRLRKELRRRLLEQMGPRTDVVAGTAVRSRDSLRRAGECLGRARTLIEMAGDEELVAAELRMALDELGLVVGAVHSEDVLDRVFSRFCVGK